MSRQQRRAEERAATKNPGAETVGPEAERNVIPMKMEEMFEAAKPMIRTGIEMFESSGFALADLGVLVTDDPKVRQRVARHAPAGAKAVALVTPVAMLRQLAAEYDPRFREHMAEAPRDGGMWCMIRVHRTGEVAVTSMCSATLSPGGAA